MRNPYTKFQNLSIHSSKLMLCTKICNVKMPKTTKGHNLRSIFQIFFFFKNQVIYSLLPIYSSIFQGSSFNNFWDILLTRFHSNFSKGHNSGKGIILIRKKICVSYFVMRNPYMKFQNPSKQGSEVMLCIKPEAISTPPPPPPPAPPTPPTSLELGQNKKT